MNDKQQSIEWYIIGRHDLEIESRLGEIEPVEYGEALMKLEKQAREMYKNEIEMTKLETIEITIIKHCAEMSTRRASTYADGYSEGYKRALEYMINTIQNKISTKEQ
jgi:hypothetical protein